MAPHADQLRAAHDAATEQYVEGEVVKACDLLRDVHAAEVERLQGVAADLEGQLEQAGQEAAGAIGQRDDAVRQLVAVRAELDQALARIRELETPPPSTGRVQPTGMHSSGVPIVRLQDLGVSLDGPGLKAALAKDQGGRIVSTPPGMLAEVRDFTYGNGGYWVHNGVGGLLGTPGAPLRLGLVAGSSTKAAQVAALGAGSTNPFYVLVANDSSRGRFVLGDVEWLPSNVGHLHGGAQIRTNAGHAEVYGQTGAAFAPGDKWFPPGETFGLNLWRCASAELRDLDLDGGGVCSSLLGFNNVPTSRVLRATLRNSPYGMPTWWQCGDVYTEDLASLGGHSGINHERVGGRIHHVRPVLRPDRARFPNAMHFGFNSDQDAYKGTLLIEDAVGDAGLRNGALMIHVDDVYNGVPNKVQTSDIAVRKAGKVLVGYDMSASGTKPAGNPAENYSIYR